MTLRRALVVLLVLLVLAGVVVVVAELLARRQVEADVERLVERELARATEDGEPFASVETTVEGWALPALVRGELDAVLVDARDGTVEGVPVRSLDVRAGGVAVDGSSAERLEAVVVADAARALVSQLDDEELAEAVVSSATAVPPDRLRAGLPFQVPVLGSVTVDVEVVVRAADGGLVVEPASARVAGLDLDLTRLDLEELDLEQLDPDQAALLGGWSLPADRLPAGLRVDDVVVEDEDGAAVVRVTATCASGCPLQP